ncbi:MAG: helix-turn-helix domain-containing protein [Deltaproteobacteria bacterium]|nr:helix-turn-helix domain-containing protein [Deltaproteobacteria bacterium]MBW2069417.1 helix-turn-helix domain-containing protein [Deltaproteobacteria bacterium]
MEYDIREAARILDLSEKEIREYIDRGMLTARREDGEWLIPDWAIRVFRRTLETLEKVGKLNKPSQEEMYWAIVDRLDHIVENMAAVRQELEQRAAIFDRLASIERVMQEKEMEVEKLKSELRYRIEIFEKEIGFLRLENKRLSDEVVRLRKRLEELRGDESRATTQVPAVSENVRERQGFWDRFLRMLTWD